MIYFSLFSNLKTLAEPQTSPPMQSILKNKAIRRSLLLLGLVSILQPYMVLIAQYGPSAKCLKCLIIEQTFIPSVFYLFLPLTGIYLILITLKKNATLQGLFVVAYYVPVSFVKITIPLFEDRIASWSTFSEQEIWDTAKYMALPPMTILACFIFVLLVFINKKTASVRQSDWADEMTDVDKK